MTNNFTKSQSELKDSQVETGEPESHTETSESQTKLFMPQPQHPERPARKKQKKCLVITATTTVTVLIVLGVIVAGCLLVYWRYIRNKNPIGLVTVIDVIRTESATTSKETSTTSFDAVIPDWPYMCIPCSDFNPRDPGCGPESMCHILVSGDIAARRCICAEVSFLP